MAIISRKKTGKSKNFLTVLFSAFFFFLTLNQNIHKTPHHHLKSQVWLGAVAHFYNPSYSGGRDWEDQGSKPAMAKR
jgi:hypothetical protein